MTSVRTAIAVLTAAAAAGSATAAAAVIGPARSQTTAALSSAGSASGTGTTGTGTTGSPTTGTGTGTGTTGTGTTGTGTTGTGTTPTATPKRAILAQFQCTEALDPPNRSMAVQSVMRPLTGTRRMQVRFDLQQKLPSATGTPPTVSILRGGDLGTWLTPANPTLGQLPADVWRLNKVVYDLPAPATYRFRVSFRWTGDHGRTLGTATRLSATCQQRELRPDLLVASIAVTPIAGKPNKDLYAAVISNAGATAAGPFEVLFTPGDSSAPITHTVQRLDAHQSRTETFVGPVCNAASPPTVIADATGVVDDLNRSNNTLIATCPAPASGSAVSSGSPGSGSGSSGSGSSGSGSGSGSEPGSAGAGAWGGGVDVRGRGLGATARRLD
jgi:uncharacterized membrane protein YgcG